VFDRYLNFFLRHGLRGILNRAPGASEFDRACRGADEITREAIAVLEKEKQRNASFFLFLNYMDAHSPYTPPSGFDDKFEGKDPGFTHDDFMELREQVLHLERKVTPRERQHLISQYDGGIAFIDAEIRRLTSRLKELGLYDNTLIVITSDHGEAFGERGLIEHAVSSVHQDQIFVPLLIKYPRSSRKGSVSALVSHVDLMPAALEAVGLKTPREVQGHSLPAPGVKLESTVITEAFTARAKEKRLNFTERALYSGSMKWITSTAGHRELYDLAQDPDERKNLYSTGSPIAEAMQADLERWLEAVPREQAPSNKVDKETLERLKSLGYTQ
jgi:arylsulfatase A-like enzyme